MQHLVAHRWPEPTPLPPRLVDLNARTAMLNWHATLSELFVIEEAMDIIDKGLSRISAHSLHDIVRRAKLREHYIQLEKKRDVALLRFNGLHDD